MEGATSYVNDFFVLEGRNLAGSPHMVIWPMSQAVVISLTPRETTGIQITGINYVYLHCKLNQLHISYQYWKILIVKDNRREIKCFNVIVWLLSGIQHHILTKYKQIHFWSGPQRTGIHIPLSWPLDLAEFQFSLVLYSHRFLHDLSGKNSFPVLIAKSLLLRKNWKF